MDRVRGQHHSIMTSAEVFRIPDQPTHRHTTHPPAIRKTYLPPAHVCAFTHLLNTTASLPAFVTRPALKYTDS